MPREREGHAGPEKVGHCLLSNGEHTVVPVDDDYFKLPIKLLTNLQSQKKRFISIYLIQRSKLKDKPLINQMINTLLTDS